MGRGGLGTLIVVSFVVGVAWGLSWAVLAPYLRLLGYSGSEYGLLGGSAVFASTFSTLAAGVLSDLVGARRVIQAGLLVSAVAAYLISLGGWWFLVAGFLLNGVGGGLFWVSRTAYAARISSSSRLHYSLSFLAAANVVGGAVGSFAGWAPVAASRLTGAGLAETYSWSIRVAGLLVLVSAVAAGSLRLEGGLERARPSFRGLGRTFYALAGIEVIVGFGAAMAIHNIDYYFAAKYGVTSGELGSVLGLEQLAMGLLMLKMPSLADRAGGPVKLYLALAYPSVPLLVAITLTNSYPVAAALYIARTIMMNVANPLLQAFTLNLVPRERQGMASSLLSLSWTLPGGLGRAVGGYLLDVDLELPLRLTATIYTFSLAGIAYVASRARPSGLGAARLEGLGGQGQEAGSGAAE